MKNLWKVLLSLGALSGTTTAHAQSIWDRRDPGFAYMFQDFKARHVGDVLTIVVSETTEFEGLEKRELNKETKTGATYAIKGKAGNDAISKSAAADFDGIGGSQRKFDSKNNSTIDRRFLDRMSVTVLAVAPNGNLLVEGYRKRVMNREVRTLRVRGVVRPADIGAFNTVQSQFIADFEVAYVGRGPETSYTNHGWWGRVMNGIWPY